MTDTILVVDDEPDLEDLVRQKFRRQIRDGAFAFLFARDGVDALEQIAARDDIDLVVTDINMPRMDGLTLIERLASAERRLSAIIVSAYGDMPNIRTAMNRGAFDFLTKPIDFGDFETTVVKTLAHVAALREARDRQAQAERAQAALARYFSPNLARSLAGDATALAGRRREIATLFTDIAGFTALVETLDADILTVLLSEYLTGMTEIVFEREGTVAKIIGDAIHVLFGAPADQPDAAARAIACALALDEWAEGFRVGWREKGVNLGHTRIGVHAGLGRRRQFRRRSVVRLHGLWRHDQRRRSLGSGQQDLRHPHLRQRRCSRASRRLRGSADRRPDLARTRRTPARLRAATRGAHEVGGLQPGFRNACSE